ncbi:MAG: YciI family protein [Defluviicoccus sp.]|nr:YciI family protein [Defluviicoccus sp.]
MAGPRVMKEDVMNACAGMLQKQLYVVFTTPTNGLGPVMENIGPHLEYQVSLEERGIMFGAGPFWSDDETEWLGEGMVIVRASSLDEAKQIAAADPMHASGARSFTIRPWLMNEGTVTVRIRYSDGSREVI